MSLEEAIEVLKEDYILIPKQRSKDAPSKADIINGVSAIVCKEYGIDPESLKTHSREGLNPQIRYRVMYLIIKVWPGISYKYLAGYFNKRSHCIVVHAVKKLQGEIDVMPKIKAEMEMLEQRVREELIK